MKVFKSCSKLAILLAISSWSCQSIGTIGNVDNTDENPVVVLELNENITYQTIDHFGASDAWSGQFVGKWPEDKKEAIADLLFSQNVDENGSPIGIGLSLWRFNIGAGSAEQGSESGIRDEWRRAESFLEPDGSYNWDKQKGQVWFAEAAKTRGVDKLLLFSNSPHVSLTRNGKAFADDGKSNLSPEQHGQFAEYLANVVEGLGKKGLKADYLSPVNEPQWDWSDGGQEGSPLWNNEIAGIVKELALKLDDKGLTTKIDVAETAQINYLYEEDNRPGRGNVVSDFFDPQSDNYIGDIDQVSHTVSAHSYFTTSPFSSSIEKRSRLAATVGQVPRLKYWMSEYCILGDNDGEIKGNGRDLGIDPALYMARVIHSDLVVAQASAWHWWLAVSPYDYKDGLVYTDYKKEDGNYYESKMLWALGNYSRFIRPGFQRIEVSSQEKKATDPEFLFSAYKSPETNEVVVVIINSGIEDTPVRLSRGNDTLVSGNAYITSNNEDLSISEIKDGDAIIVPARSIMTITTQ